MQVLRHSSPDLQAQLLLSCERSAVMAPWQGASSSPSPPLPSGRGPVQVLHPPPGLIIHSRAPSAGAWTGRGCLPAPPTPRAQTPAPPPRVRLAARLISGSCAPRAWSNSAVARPTRGFPASATPPHQERDPRMEREERYLELYLDRCTAQVSLAAAARSQSQGLRPALVLERQVLRCQGFAFFVS